MQTEKKVHIKNYYLHITFHVIVTKLKCSFKEKIQAHYTTSSYERVKVNAFIKGQLGPEVSKESHIKHLLYFSLFMY